MIRYFDGRIKLNTTEMEELITLYRNDGRKIDVKLNVYNEPEVAIYTYGKDGEKEYKIADLYGSTAEILFNILGITDNPKYRCNLKEIIEKYCD